MLDWKQLPNDSRVWVYQADRLLTEDEVVKMNNLSEQFVMNWSSHGTPLEAAIGVFHHLFLVVFVNEKQAMASGCSIDKSMAFVQQLEKQFQLSFTNRMLVAGKKGDTIELFQLNILADKIKSGALSVSDLVFNNLVQSKADFEQKWLVKIEDSWHKQFV